MRQVQLIVSCTDRKSVAPAPDLVARALPTNASVDERSREWIRRLENTEVATTPASDLYAGDHWRVAAGLPEIAADRGVKATLWVVSAGYGLIAADTALKAYSATFAVRSPDAVVLRSDTVASTTAWWEALTKWPGARAGAPRSITELATARPNDVLLVAASSGYVAAMADDLAMASTRLRTDSLLVASAGLRAGSVEALPTDARLQAEFGGSLQSLNARVARWIVATSERHNFDRNTLSGELTRLLEGLPPRRIYNRQQLCDSELHRLISEALAHEPNLSKSALLRRLRDRNMACEQGRFGRAFELARQGAT